jgi:hypothetical protein
MGGTMKREKVSELDQEDSRHENFKESQNHCPLCNSQLTIKVETYLENYTLKEEASCPKCQLLARVKDHKMH